MTQHMVVQKSLVRESPLTIFFGFGFFGFGEHKSVFFDCCCAIELLRGGSVEC